MSEKLDSTRTALVDTKAYWKPITPDTPRGAKVFLINEKAKSATTGTIGNNEGFFTHYFPMPIFDSTDGAQRAIERVESSVPDVELRPEDFTVEVIVTPMGGFNPNVTHGVRVTHKPTGLSVSCDSERSQHKNRHIAFEQLKEMLADHFKIAPQPAVPKGEPVAWLDLSKMSASAMVYATGWKSNDKQSPLYTAPAPAPVVPQGDTVEVIGMKGGKEHHLGNMRMPPRMRAREIAREQFGHFEDDDGSDAELCFGALEQLIDYMQATQSQPAVPEQVATRSQLAIGRDAIEYEKGQSHKAGYKQGYEQGRADAAKAMSAMPEDMRMVPASLLEELESSLYEFGQGRCFTSIDLDRYKRLGEVLAATPAAPSQQPVTLTDEQRQQVFRDAENRMMRDINLSWRNAVVDEVERAIAALREKGGVRQVRW